MSLQAISIPAKTGKPPAGLFVALHGWGANAQDLASLAFALNLPAYQMLFPNAPFPYPYSPGGRAWYNFPETYAFESDAAFAARPDLVESRRLLTEWLRSLPDLTGVPLERTVLAGFSQGGAMTLDVGLGLPLAALLVLSGYLHAPVQIGNAAPPPVLMVHGRQDQVVPMREAERSRDQLLALNISVSFHELAAGHEISPEVLKIVQNFTEELRLQPDGAT